MVLWKTRQTNSVNPMAVVLEEKLVGVSDCKVPEGDIVYIEPYYGGSHKDFINVLQKEFNGDLYTLPPSKWNWRMRVSALYFSECIPMGKQYKILFASSVLNLSELIALRPDLAGLHKILYFHENQLVYPVRKQQDRDFQHGYSQILSCLVADKVIFNSQFNKDSFLSSIQSFMRIVPDFRPKHLREKIFPKCSVLYIPILLLAEVGNVSKDEALADEDLKVLESRHPLAEKRGNSLHLIPGEIEEPARDPSYEDLAVMEEIKLSSTLQAYHEQSVLHIVWPHRWEHDKNPEVFCSLLTKLIDCHLAFVVSILGSHTNDIPDSLQKIIPVLGSRLLHKGHLPQHHYRKVLLTADVVISTAKHEFFGVAMLEAVFCGCYPLCPNRLVYPEFYPSECLYNTEEQLFKRIMKFCHNPSAARDAKIEAIMSNQKFSWNHLRKSYRELLGTNDQ